MGNSLFDLLLETAGAADDRIYGLVIGIVTNNQDPENLFRVKIKFPWLDENTESDWARVVTPMAGNNRGCYFLPEVEDEVLVGFERGDMRFPYVLGALWNNEDVSPEANENGENNRRLIKSRSGHVIAFDDQESEPKIEIIDHSGKNKIIINTNENSITISADADITITSNRGKLKLSGSGVEINSKADVKIEATGNLELKGMAVKGDATSSMDLNASGMMNVKGSMVKIN